MPVTFSNPQIKHEAAKKLYHCTYTVSGNTEDPTATTAEGVGKNEYQAKRHAIVSYTSLYPKVFLGIDEASLTNDIIILPTQPRGFR